MPIGCGAGAIPLQLRDRRDGDLTGRKDVGSFGKLSSATSVSSRCASA
jgi:hypothetical protein